MIIFFNIVFTISIRISYVKQTGLNFCVIDNKLIIETKERLRFKS